MLIIMIHIITIIPTELFKIYHPVVIHNLPTYTTFLGQGTSSTEMMGRIYCLSPRVLTVIQGISIESSHTHGEIV